MHEQDLEKLLSRIDHLLEQADRLIVAAGAGIGIDSDLSDFRRDQGFWKAYSTLASGSIFGRRQQIIAQIMLAQNDVVHLHEIMYRLQQVGTQN